MVSKLIEMKIMKKYIKIQSYCLYNNPKPRRIRPQSAGISVLSTADYERIRQSARVLTNEEVLNNKKISAQEKECMKAKARAHINKMKEFDKTRPKRPLTAVDREKIVEGNNILAAARRARENNMDAARDMDQMLKYAKVVTVRDIQKKEHKMMEDMYKKKEAKLDLMMELERLKELKFLEDKEKELKRQRYEGGRIIIDQIKENDVKRMQEKEQVRREGEMMKKQIALLQEEERRRDENKKREQKRMAKEIENINKISELNKQKKKLADREEDLRNLKYNMDKAKKEEEALYEKMRQQKEKEMETQKLREKQERAQDKQAALDELRAKRAFEEAEKKARQKELEELLKLQKQKEELIEGNEKQKELKKIRLEEQAMAEQRLYQDIIKKQIADMEEERRMEEERKKIFYENGDDVRRQIKEKEEKRKVKIRGITEEGREIQERLDEYKRTMERIKREKLAEMEKYHIDPKYRVDLEKYKIK